MAKNSRRNCPTLPELSEDSRRFMEDLQKETDRGVALVGAAFLDDVLAALLRAAMVDDSKITNKLLEYPGPVSTSAARADLAYCMGLLGPDMYADLKVIREVRNRFGHSHVPASFEDAEIARLCGQLKTARLIKPEPCTASRLLFILAVVMIANHLMLGGLRAKHPVVGTDLRLAQHVQV